MKIGVCYIMDFIKNKKISIWGIAMKVKCEQCNKKFDRDIYSGICPRCGEIYRSLDDNNDSHMPSKGKMKKINIFLILLVILFPLIGFGVAKYVNMQEIKKRTNRNTVSPVEIEMNKAFSCTLSGVDYCEIIITGATIDKDEKLNIPEGYDMLVVSYEVHTPMTDEESEYTDNPRDYHCSDIRPYLVTREQYYLNPIHDYKIEDIKGWDYKKSEENGVSTALTYRRGTLYYLVKEGDAGGLWITQYDEDESSGYDSNYVESYKLTELEVSK